MKTPSSTWFRPAFAALAYGLLLSACGGSDQAAAPPAATYGAPAAAAAPAASQSPATAAASTPAALGTQTLDYPDDLQMLLLAYRLTGSTAPLDDWAAQAPPVRTADEFSRPQALKTERERLAAIAASVADVGRLRIKTSSNFSEYDAAKGGFYLNAFQPGSAFGFKAQNEEISLRLSNSGEAFLWPLDAAAAQEALQKAGSHSVDLDLTLAVERASRRASGLQIDARVLDYRVISNRYGNAQLGSVVLH